MKDIMFLKSRKKGVTVAMALTMILIISIMTTTITIAVINTVKGSKLKAFATELSLVQSTIQEFAFSGSINEYLADDVTLTITSTQQFEGETVENSTVLLHILDLHKMGMEKSVYGTGKDANGKDYYAVSLDTMKVYYVAGYDSGDKVYYALTDELIQVLNGENKVVYTKNIVFKANTVQWTNEPITVTVKVPNRIDLDSVTVQTDNTNIGISSFENKGEYNECIVNNGSAEGNYTITVQYTLDGSEKTETYAITNFDNEAPVIIAGNRTNNLNGYYLNNIEAIDNGRIKIIKYIDISIPKSDAHEFFEKGGTVLKGKRIKLDSEDSTFTIYAEDFAGNYTIDIVTVPDGFYYVGGTKETGLVISDNMNDKNKGVDYVCSGNQFVWVPVDYTVANNDTKDEHGLKDSFKNVFKRGLPEEAYYDEETESYIYKMTASIGSEEPYKSEDLQEYYEMSKSVQEYHGFYIARFEAGDGTTSTARTDVTQEVHTVVSKKGAYVYNYVLAGDARWTYSEEADAAYLARNMGQDAGYSSVTSTLCYEEQWDAVMNFVSDVDHDIWLDSSTWGNYDVSETPSSLQTCGSNESWKAKNIYDLAGNAMEWNMAHDYTESYRIFERGTLCDIWCGS